MSRNQERIVTYVKPVTERTHMPDGQWREIPTGEMAVHLADGRTVTFDPVTAGRLGSRMAVGRRLQSRTMAWGKVSGVRARGNP